MLKHQQSDRSTKGKTTEFVPPMSEFNMLVTELEGGESDTVKPVRGPSILFVTNGSGSMAVEGQNYTLEAGSTFFVGQGVEVEMSASKKLEAYRAYSE
jgi:mannose-6-phosphate isomerase